MNDTEFCQKCSDECDADYMTEGLWYYVNVPEKALEAWLKSNTYFDMDAFYCYLCADEIETKILGEI